MSKNIGILLLLCHFLFPSIASAQNYYFKQVSIQEGMSQSTIQAILCDHKQSLWLGTKDGLNRHNGYELANYFNDPQKKNSLMGNNIFFILEDQKKNLWIATQNGVCQYIEKKDHFVPLLANNKEIHSRCYTLLDDGVAFISKGYIYRYYYDTKKVDIIPITGEAQTVYLTQAQAWKDNTVLVGGRWASLYLLDLKTGKSSFFSKNSIQDITALLVDKQNKIWVAQYNKGVNVLTEKGEKIAEYTVENSELNNNIVLGFLQRQEQLWMATDGGGINILNMETRRMSTIEHISGEMNTLPVNSITCLYEDSENNIWAGSVRGGAFGIQSVNMRTYLDVPTGSSNGLSDRSVISLLEDNDKTLWIGTDGGGINRFDPVAQHFTHYPNTYKEKVTSIHEFNQKELLISIFGKGLFRFNKQSGVINPLPVVDKYTSDSIYSVGIPIILHPGKENMLYILGAKLILLNTLTQTYIKIGPQDRYGKWLQPFYHSKEYSYLLSESKIYKLDHTNHELQEIWASDGDKKLTSACFDGKETFYIGSTAGMIIHSLKSKQSHSLSTSLFGSITSMFWEHPNRIWIGAKNKLFAYNPIENKFIIFGASDGMLPNELLMRPSLMTSQGDIYMGGSMGLLRIDKNKIPTYFPTPKLTLSRIEINDQYNEQDKESFIQKIDVPWNFNTIELSFTVKEKSYFREKKFKYTIEGNTTMVIESPKPFITLTSLPVGKYKIIAQCDTQNGEWTEQTVYATLIVNPPWWKSVLAIILYILAALSFIILGVFYYIKKSKDQLKWEMKEHAQKVNEEKIQFLININHELRTPLTLIYAPLKRMIDNKTPTLEQLKNVFHQSQKMKNIINMVLDIRKMEVGKETLHFETVDFNLWAASLIDDFKSEFEVKKIELSLEMDTTIGFFTFDKDKCEKSFTNLLMNALKFSNPNSTVKISTVNLENRIRLYIADQGIGLGEHPERIFQRFYQGEHNRGGTGIGLSYAKLMVEIQGGSIGAYNNEISGATFFIDLPQRLSSPNSLFCEPKPYINELLSAKKSSDIQIKSFNTQQYTLLIVEDEPELCHFLKNLLNDKFKKVYTAKNGEHGFEEVINRQPDIVVSDVMMPLMDGYELCRNIKNDLRCSHIPVILLTALENNQSRILGYKTGADAYLSKPFDNDILISIIETQLKNREYIKARYKNSSFDTHSIQEVIFSNADELFLDKLNNLILNNLDQNCIGVKFLSEELGLSRSSLYRKINLLIGIGIGEYIDKIRLKKATEWLVNTKWSIQEIADKAGFNTPRYFSHVFKQAYGISPSKYRANKTLAKANEEPEKEKQNYETESD